MLSDSFPFTTSAKGKKDISIEEGHRPSSIIITFLDIKCFETLDRSAWGKERDAPSPRDATSVAIRIGERPALNSPNTQSRSRLAKEC